MRYQNGPTPWRAATQATETDGRLGKEALTHLQKLVRKQAEALDEGGGAAVSYLLTKWPPG